ncbi:four helix bundle protein [Clostridium cadaveris]|uniref:four helix bundle protein n=1 Tax=Clostridium cadaveris TaxID=1529 RepID=UPI0031D7118B
MIGPIVEQSIEFDVDIVEYYKWLVYEKKEFVLSKQILRSGTSIGANVHEGNFAVSRNDFIYRMQIALKEASETEYWLIILAKTGFLPQNFHSLKNKCTSLKKMLISTLNTAKNKN